MRPASLGRTVGALVCSAAILAGSVSSSLACTRAVYVGENGLVLTGRTMDWMEDMSSNIWALPAGMKRDGAAGPNSVTWTSKYGSVAVAAYEVGTADGINEKGLVANLLYLTSADFGQPAKGKPEMSVAVWAQYVLDNYATVNEAVAALEKEPFRILAPKLPNGKASTLHLSISDATGDSAIFEYVGGKLKIHHDKKYTVMTNEPPFDEQLAINKYWKEVGGTTFIPGTTTGADRFVRASFLLSSVPKKVDPAYIKGVPDQSYEVQAVASLMGVMRSVSVPLGISTPDRPNLSSTIWRTVSDQTNPRLYFDSATRADTFWVSLSKLDLKPGAPARRLTLQNGELYAGETADKFEKHEMFKFLPATE
ncbi:linear amide C-N hydrolase [Mesorhizobium sp. VK25A]|nr:linear amide C-N hydrolase [Mesorhizobium sp. VK25A]MDX8543426.1 linear amide C-N hydrolase [Mesorhizobium sp. VK25A]